MCAFTADDGSYSDVIVALCERFRLLHGAPLRVLGISEMAACKVPTAHWIKAWLFKYAPRTCDAVLWLDADTIPYGNLIDINPCGWEFAAVRDEWVIRTYHREPEYFNSGMFFARRGRGERALSMLREAQHSGHDGMFDQSHLNNAVRATCTSVALLPKTYNWQRVYGDPPPAIKLWHCAGPDKSELRARWRSIHRQGACA